MLFFSRSPLVLHSFQSACTETGPGLLFPVQAGVGGGCWVAVVVLFYYKWHSSISLSCGPFFVFPLKYTGIMTHRSHMNGLQCSWSCCLCIEWLTLNCGYKWHIHCMSSKSFFFGPFLVNFFPQPNENMRAKQLIVSTFSFARSFTSKWSVCPA